MPDENTLGPDVKAPSRRRGDVPERLMQRYYTDGRGGDGLAFYVDARVPTPAFRDRGGELVATRADPNAIRDMLVIAEHRGWAIVTVKGSNDFRRQAWLAGRAMGLEVQGYRATERDLQDLARRQAAAQRTQERPEERQERREDRRHHRDDTAAARRLRVVETVVRARVSDRDRQDAIMAAARERIVDWLERGGRFERPRTEHTAPERQRGP